MYGIAIQTFSLTYRRLGGRLPAFERSQFRPALRDTRRLRRLSSLSAIAKDRMIPGKQNLTFYKRTLPSPPATEFSSKEGMALFQEALADGTMMGFFKLVEQYRTQTEPAFCGLTSLAMVLNALCIDPRRTWKAPWRWFDETLLDCCKALESVKAEGIDFEQLTCLAQCNGAQVSMHPFGTFQLETFRELIRTSCQSTEQHLIVSYTRKSFKQTGDGHFSPIGGYHAAKDLVLILDTARFKYPPHWVSVELLFTSMGELDKTTSKPRGFLLLKAPEKPVSVCFTLNRTDNWKAAEQFIQRTAPEKFTEMALSGSSLESILRELVVNCPLESVQKFVAVRVSGCACSGEPGPIPQRQVFAECQTFPFYQEVEKHLNSIYPDGQADKHLIGRVTALLLLRPPELWSGLEDRPDTQREFYELTDLTNTPL